MNFFRADLNFLSQFFLSNDPDQDEQLNDKSSVEARDALDNIQAAANAVLSATASTTTPSTTTPITPKTTKPITTTTTEPTTNNGATDGATDLENAYLLLTFYTGIEKDILEDDLEAFLEIYLGQLELLLNNGAAEDVQSAVDIIITAAVAALSTTTTTS